MKRTMLDYDKLAKEFKEFIKTVDKKDFQKWVEEQERMEMNTQQKCVKILKRIVELNQDINDQTCVKFTPDWSNNSLTVEFKGGHTHCGNPEGNFKQLIDSLYNMLCENKGLSLVKQKDK